MVRELEKTAELMLIVWHLGICKDFAGSKPFDDLSALSIIHWPTEIEDWRTSPVTEKLSDLLDDECVVRRKGAAVALGHIAPCLLLAELEKRLPARTLFDMDDERDCPLEWVGDFEAGIEEAVAVLSNSYLGDLCCGKMETAEALELGDDADFERLVAACRPIIEHFRERPCGRLLAGFVRALCSAVNWRGGSHPF